MSEDFAYRAKVLITQRRYQDAVRLCRRGLLTDPSREEGRLVLGMALLAMRRFEEVRAEMLTLLRLRPEDAVARRLLGQAFLEAGDLVRAEEELLAAQRLAPHDPRIADLLNDLAEAREIPEPASEPSGRWAEPEDLQTTPGEAPDAALPSLTVQAPRARTAFEITPVASRTPAAGDERTIPDPVGGGLRLEVPVSGDVITKVLPEEDAQKILEAARALTRAAEPIGATPPPGMSPAPIEVAPGASADDVLGAEAPTDVVGPPPVRPGPAVSAKGWPDEPPPTITPVMPALVRAAARLAAATRGKSSLRPAVDAEPTPAPDSQSVSRNPGPSQAVEAAPDARRRDDASLVGFGGAATPQTGSDRPSGDGRDSCSRSQSETPAPLATLDDLRSPGAPVVRAPSVPVAAAPAPASSSPPSLPRGFDPLEIDTKSYAEASEEARARDAARAVEPRPRKASLEEVLVAQAKFAEAVSEISEVSEVDSSSLPRPLVDLRAPLPAPPAPEARKPVADAPRPPSEPAREETASTDEEPEATVTEVPQSYREGGGRGTPARPAAPPPAPPPPPPEPRASVPPTMVAKPVGSMPTQHAGEAVASSQGIRPTPAPPVRPVPEPLRPRPVSETVPAPALPEERVTRALDPAERVDRDSSLPPARLSQPPSFLEPPVESSRRPKTATPPPIGPSLSSLPPAVMPPLPLGRVTMPVIDEDSEPPKRASEPTVDGSPRDLLGKGLRDSDDSVMGAVDRFDALSGRVPVAFARRDPPRTPAPAPPAAPFPAAPPFKPPPRAAGAAFDPLDRPLSPEEFESSISRSGLGDEPPGALTASGQESAFLAPEDVISGSEQIPLAALDKIAPIPSPSGSPLDEPLSPDDFSYSGPGARAPSISVAPAPGTGDPLDEPLSPDDFSYEPARAGDLRGRVPDPIPRPPPVKPLVGPAPPMAVPRDALRPVPMHSSLQPSLPPDPLDEPLAPSEFSAEQAPAPSARNQAPAPKRVEAKAPVRVEAAARAAPVRIVAKKGQPPVKVATKPLPKQRARSDSRLLRYAIPSAVAAIVLVLAVAGLMHYRSGRLRAEKIEAAEHDEAQGDYGSLRRALAAYREVSDEIPDSREMLARVARSYALLAFEFGLAEDERQAQELLGRLGAMGAPDAASAPIEAAARGYLLAGAGRVDDAEAMLRMNQAPDPHVSYLRARISLQREAYTEAERVLRQSTQIPPSWVRQSMALVEAILGKDPQGTEWARLLDSLGQTYGSHVGVRLLRARLLSESPHTRANARIELQALAQPALWNAAAPSEQAWVHLLNALQAAERRETREEANRELAAARDLRPSRDSKFRLTFVRVLLALHQLAEAKTELQTLTQDMAPRARSQARLLLAETYIELGQLSDADALLEQCEESARRHWLKGRVLMALGQADPAIAEFTQAKRQDPSLTLQADLLSARAKLRIGEAGGAVALVNAILEQHPNDFEALMLLGDAYLADPRAQARFTLAEGAYTRAAAAAPESIEPLMRLANLARGRGDVTTAMAKLGDVIARDPSNMDAQIARASIAAESGDIDDARAKLATIQRLPNARSEIGSIAVLEAEIELRAGNLAVVEAHLQRAEQNGAPPTELAHISGLLKLRTYNVQEALGTLRRAQQAMPGDAVRSAELARAHRLSRTAAAETQALADSALQIDPRVPEALIVKALIAMDIGSLGPAADLVRQAEQSIAARHRDKNTTAFVTMGRGRFEYEMGRSSDAQRQLEAALALDPNLAEAHFFLALTYIDLNRSRDACTSFGRFLEIAPGVRDTADATSERHRIGCH